MAKQTKISDNWMKTTIITAICAAILAVIANSAFWVNRYIFNTENFTQVATTSLTSESSRRAIAQQITNKVLADYPTVRNLVDDTAVNLISGVLGSDQFETVLTKTVSKLQVVVTSNNQESITINLEGPKDLITKVVDVVGQNREVKINPENIPSEITVLDKDKIPDFYKYGVLFLWLGPISLIGAIVLLSWPYVKYKSEYKLIMLVQGGALLGASLLALLVGPLFRPPLLSKVPSSEARTVLGNLYNAFIATFNSQTKILIVVGLLAMVVGTSLVVVSNVRKRRISR